MRGFLGTAIFIFTLLAIVGVTIWLGWAAVSCWTEGGTWVAKAFPQKCIMP